MVPMRTALARGIRHVSSCVASLPRTLNELESQIGRLQYRNVNKELASYLLVNKLTLIKRVRSYLYQSEIMKDQPSSLEELMDSSKYFTYRIFLYESFRAVQQNKLENFNTGKALLAFDKSGAADNDNVEPDLELIFQNYTKTSPFQQKQKLIEQIVDYLVRSDKKVTYQLYSVLIENFNKVGLTTVSTLIFDSITKLPHEVLNFKHADNYLCETDEQTLELLLRHIYEEAFPREYKQALNLLNVNSNAHLLQEQKLSRVSPKHTFAVHEMTHAEANDMRLLRPRFFNSLKGVDISLTQNGRTHTLDRNLLAVSSDTMIWYLKAALRMKFFNFFRLLCRKWIFNSIIVKNGKEYDLKILINNEEEDNFFKAYQNLGQVKDYGTLFNRDFIKVFLKYCYVRKDEEAFAWILNLLQSVFMVNQRLYLKYTYDLELIDNEIVSLIWLNCKNLDHEVYKTWCNLEAIFKLDQIFNDYEKQRFIAINCK